MKRSIAWLIPGLGGGSGGHRTIFRYVQHLQRQGLESHVYVEPVDGLGRLQTPAITARLARRFHGTEGVRFHVGFRPQCEHDIVVATMWHTAHAVHRDFSASRKVYFIQDYEPFFYPVGEHYFRAESSYDLGLQPITIGRWLSRKIQEICGHPVHFVDFCADLATFRPADDGLREDAICFLYQPSKARRCAEIGLQALQLVHDAQPEVKIYLYGARERAKSHFPAIHLGLLSPGACNDLYHRCRVGICLSSTNPSRIPFEMMAAGLPVIDLHGPQSLYDMPEEGAMLADPRPEGIAEAVISLLDDEQQRRRMSAGGAAFMKNRPIEREAQQFADALDHILADNPPALSTHHPIYTRPAIHGGASALPTPSPLESPHPFRLALRLALRLVTAPIRSGLKRIRR